MCLLVSGLALPGVNEPLISISCGKGGQGFGEISEP